MTALDRIAQLNVERYGLTFNANKAIEKLKEELEEFIEAETVEDQIDALADLIVISAGEIRKLGYDPELVLDETIREIESREQDPEQEARWQSGIITSGEKWKKNSNQNPDTLYSADYDNAKIK